VKFLSSGNAVWSEYPLLWFDFDLQTASDSIATYGATEIDWLIEAGDKSLAVERPSWTEPQSKANNFVGDYNYQAVLLARNAEMGPIATGVARSVVCVSVYMSECVCVY